MNPKVLKIETKYHSFHFSWIVGRNDASLHFALWEKFILQHADIFFCSKNLDTNNLWKHTDDDNHYVCMPRLTLYTLFFPNIIVEYKQSLKRM
jgi:hypothetical protein